MRVAIGFAKVRMAKEPSFNATVDIVHNVVLLAWSEKGNGIPRSGREPVLGNSELGGEGEEIVEQKVLNYQY